MNKWLKKTLAGMMISGGLLISQVWASTSPYVLMQQVADKLFNDIKTNQNNIKSDPNYLKTIVHNDIMPYIHVKYAGQLVLGKALSSATEAQKERFFTVFGKFVEQSYAQVLTQYSDQKIQIENDKPLGDKSLVSIRVNLLQSASSSPIKLDFKWRKNKTTGEWQAYDMAAEGISMVATKQSEWSGIIRQQGIDALINQVEASAKQPIVINKK